MHFVKLFKWITPLLCLLSQKITLEDLSESRSALDEKSADPSHSVNSMQTATHENSNVAVYEVGYSAFGLFNIQKIVI